MVCKYKEITEAQGPSQQLIDFINADGKLGEEIGLEGFHAFSTNTQHEILLSKLNSNVLEEAGLESLGEWLKKKRKTLLIAGFFTFGLTFWPAAVGYIISHSEGTVPPLKHFQDAVSAGEKMFKAVKELTSKIPSTFEKESWDSFTSLVNKTSAEFDKNPVKELPEVKIDRGSGWTESNYKSSGDDLKRLSEEAATFSKSIGAKLSGAESWASNPKNADNKGTASAVSEGISAYFKFLGKTNTQLKISENLLKRTSKFFKPKD